MSLALEILKTNNKGYEIKFGITLFNDVMQVRVFDPKTNIVSSYAVALIELKESRIADFILLAALKRCVERLDNEINKLT